MSDIGIFIFGCGVFGVALGATMISVIGASEPEADKPESGTTIRAGSRPAVVPATPAVSSLRVPGTLSENPAP